MPWRRAKSSALSLCYFSTGLDASPRRLCDRGAFCSAGPDFFSTTSPQPMMPQTTSFGAVCALHQCKRQQGHQCQAAGQKGSLGEAWF